ncbi:AMP-binding protein [Cupriavidus numazuensis]|uniref:Long-chain-fatty-acid--CoA ligase n=1 Tax=Cupriavidus numazuensis TaxID=221992 RepID=A0ABM8TQ99_9BURK|nr:AMP-binding protein [Cupriavidus numazuensis]CAG2157937.1 Long-chain-fatty-acid--CoA ligase [Cupriavidus numazuensis]
MVTKFDRELDQRAANYQPLTPLHFLNRAEDVYPHRIAIIHGDRSYTWKEYAGRCSKLAGALIDHGIERGDTVAILAPNTPAMLEAQFGVPMAGAVLNCINIRLDAAAVGFILRHSETRLLFVDQQFAEVARAAIAVLGEPITVVDITDPEVAGSRPVGRIEYESFLAGAPDTPDIRLPLSEWDAIALNYTSGTTGNPKGVVYHHRGAYLNALGQLVNAELSGDVPVYLWTLPLFHCNGWCYAWALAAVGATQICLRKVSGAAIYDAIANHDVTHFCCAPTVLSFLIESVPPSWVPPARPIRVLSGGASPPPAVFRRLIELGFRVQHVYGMTEMHGVATICQSQEAWQALPEEEHLVHLTRQGVRTVVMNEMMVADPNTLSPVSRDGSSMGEILLRGNLAMKGYFKNPSATEEAFAGGWYHTGDLAVVHADGYIEIKDRSKDIIISGGENISSVEVEDVLYEHPAVAGAAVVAVPDPRWGEVPCAIVELKADMAGDINASEIISFCRARLPGFKAPQHVIFDSLARTATGKLQKFKLRESALQHLVGNGAIGPDSGTTE